MASGKSLTLSDHLSKSCVQIGLLAGARKDLLDHLAREAVAAGLVDNHNLFLENLIKRESEMSTGVGRGLAVPHAEVSGAKETFVIGATLKDPVDYFSIDEEPVDIVFLIGGKPGEVGLHLQLLARIARLARLELNDDEVKRMTVDMNAILAHVDQLNEVDTENVSPHSFLEGKSTPRQPDEACEFSNRNEALANAPRAEGTFYIVPKVIE